VAVVIGAAGAGKTTVGARLAACLGSDSEEGDSLHPPENLALEPPGPDENPITAGIEHPIEEIIAHLYGVRSSAAELKPVRSNSRGIPWRH
jgi:adenylate kinase family enzyme